MSFFHTSKYAQMEKVLISRNMLRYNHMDECEIGTDCLGLLRKSIDVCLSKKKNSNNDNKLNMFMSIAAHLLGFFEVLLLI